MEDSKGIKLEGQGGEVRVGLRQNDYRAGTQKGRKYIFQRFHRVMRSTTWLPSRICCQSLDCQENHRIHNGLFALYGLVEALEGIFAGP